MPRPTPEIQLVVFDLGGVFVRLADGFADAAARAGVELPAEFDGDRLIRQMPAVVSEHEVGRAGTEQFMSQVAEIAGIADHEMRRVSDHWLTEPYPGLHAVLDRLEAAGVATACLSNTNASHWAIMTDPAGRCPLPLHRLDHRFASHLVGHRKPDQAIYDHLERAVGANPADILFFDDSATNIAAAHRRGWWAHRIDPNGDPAAQIRQHLDAHGIA